MASVNKIFLLGSLGQDPELKYTTSGKSYVHVSLATNEQWKDKTGESHQHTEWHHLEAWNKTAELCCQYLKKGSQLYVEGSLRSDKYTDKQGIERYVTKVMVQRMQFLDRKQAGPKEFDWETGEEF